jgi:hypothetical protein
VRPSVFGLSLSNISVYSEFFVDGNSIPEVDFDVGPSWSGLLPISGNKNETRKVRICRLLLFNLLHWPALLLVFPSRTSREFGRPYLLVGSP